MLMVIGTASSVGKSVLVTALCRIFANAGLHVAPFKAQNMSNNADVTPDGLEIGRAQSEQAAAARQAPRVEMNPVLLKPQGDRTSQVVLNGRPAGVLHSAGFLDRKRDLWPHVRHALDVLRDEYDLVIVEGAGSPAEPNLQASDIVNMAVARYAGAATLLVGDIDRGGVFAHLLGTLAYLPDEDRELVRGFIVNRFRGDPALLGRAIEDIERRTHLPVLGVVPWIDALGIAEEDAVALERAEGAAPAVRDVVDVAVIRFPRIANFDDFDPLAGDPRVRLRYVESSAELGRPALVILPGTKSTIADLAWLREQGLDEPIRAHAAAGGLVLGICGGYQVLGRRIVDVEGTEAPPGTAVDGLGLLPVETTFTPVKSTQRASGSVVAGAGPWRRAAGRSVEGYEIHMGRTGGDAPPFLLLDEQPDGAVSADGRVAGTYLHGLFHNDALRAALLEALGLPPTEEAWTAAEQRETEFERLAATVEAHVDLARIAAMLAIREPGRREPA